MRVGFAGLGRMGQRMAANLLAAGHELDDRKVPEVTEIIRRGSIWAARGGLDGETAGR